MQCSSDSYVPTSSLVAQVRALVTSCISAPRRPRSALFLLRDSSVMCNLFMSTRQFMDPRPGLPRPNALQNVAYNTSGPPRASTPGLPPRPRDVHTLTSGATPRNSKGRRQKPQYTTIFGYAEGVHGSYHRHRSHALGCWEGLYMTQCTLMHGTEG